MKKLNSLEYSRGDRVLLAFDYLLLALIVILVAYPLLFVIKSSFSAPTYGMAAYSLLPKKLTLQGYRAVFEYRPIWTSYLNSIYYMVTGTVVNILITICCAYPLSRRDLAGRRFFSVFFVFTMHFSGGLIPSYLLARNLHILNSLWVMILPGALSVYNMIVTRTYFSNQIPDELREAAVLDGCGNMRLLISIVLPLSGSVISVITLFYAVSHWNAYFHPMIYLSSRNKYPLQVILRELLILNQQNSAMSDVADVVDFEQRANLMKYSLITVASLPVMMIYPFVQKFFVKGVMIGAVKG